MSLALCCRIRTFPGRGLWVVSTSSTLLNSLTSTFKPFFVVRSEDIQFRDPTEWIVVITVGHKYPIMTPKSLGTEAVLHSEHLADVYHDGSLLTAIRHDGAASYWVDKRQRRMYIEYADESLDSCIDLLQIVRGMVIFALTKAGWNRVHGAFASRGPRGIMFIGDKGKGKTSFLFSAMHDIPGLEYIANDKALWRDENGEVVVRGLPYAAAIPLEAMETVDWLRGLDRARVIGRKAYVLHPELREVFGWSVRPTCQLEVVIDCQLDLTQRSATLVISDRELHILQAGAASAKVKDRVTPTWIESETPHFAETEQEQLRLLRPSLWLVAKGNPWGGTNWASLLDYLNGPCEHF